MPARFSHSESDDRLDLPPLGASWEEDVQYCTALFDQFFPDLVKYVARKLRQRGFGFLDAEAIAQQTFTEFWSGFSELKNNPEFVERGPIGLLCSRASERLSSAIRRARFEVRGGHSAEFPVETATSRSDDGVEDPAPQRSALLHEALDKLDAEDRQIIELRDLRGLSYASISLTMQIAIGTVKSRLFRARESLRATLVSLGFNQKNNA